MVPYSLSVQRSSQPRDYAQVNWDSPLSERLWCLVNPATLFDAVSQRPLSVVGTPTALSLCATRNAAAITSQASASNGYYLPQVAGIVNARNDWTIAALIELRSDLSGTGDQLISTSVSAADNSSVYDRALGFSTSGGNLFARGYVFDGASKSITGGTTLDYSSKTWVVAVVVCAGGGNLDLYVNGIKDATSVAISNNGYNGYAPAYFNIGASVSSTMQKYRILLVARTEGYKWGLGEAQLFTENPWQLFAPMSGARLFQSVASDILFAQCCL